MATTARPLREGLEATREVQLVERDLGDPEAPWAARHLRLWVVEIPWEQVTKMEVMVPREMAGGAAREAVRGVVTGVEKGPAAASSRAEAQTVARAVAEMTTRAVAAAGIAVTPEAAAAVVVVLLPGSRGS